jgi:hypothetical protein
MATNDEAQNLAFLFLVESGCLSDIAQDADLGGSGYGRLPCRQRPFVKTDSNFIVY